MITTIRKSKGNGPTWGLLVALAIILVTNWAQPQAADPPKPAEQSSKGSSPAWGGSDPQYLIFWGDAKRVLDVRARIGTAGDGKSHLLGFGSVNLPFDTSDEQLRERIRTAFQTARQNNIAVYFCYDFHHFWEKRPELWNWFDPARPGYNPANKDNVEWIDWQGTPNKARYLDWGTPQKLSPQMCYNCPAVKGEITRVVTQVIGPAIKLELEALVKAGQPYLFAGITVGGEPQLDDYTVIAKINPRLGKFVEEDGSAKVQLGYHALINRGYSGEHPPQDFKRALAEVNQEFVAFCAKQFFDAGISSSRLYTHVAAPSEKVVAYTNAPSWIAFNEYARPGWTTYAWGDLAHDFQPIYKQLKEHNDPPWGGVEANLGFGDSTVASWEGYLERHFNHGAKLVGINVGASGQDLAGRLERSAFGPEAIAAYKKFLSGERLEADAPPQGLGQGSGPSPAEGRAQPQAADPPKPDEQGSSPAWSGSDPQYLIFWGDAKTVLDVRARIGTAGDGKSRQIGLGLPLNTFDGEETLPARIHDAFQTAKKYNLAIALAFDSHNFWRSRADLWNWFDPRRPGYNPANKNNVEWYDWKGTPNKARYLNWGTAEKLAPHMCYTSPAVRQEITRIITTVIAPAVNSELDLLKKEGREYLFAGIIVGSEITIDDYTHPDAGIAKLMEQDGAPRGRLGYCALTQSGFSEKNPPADIRLALAAINQEFVSFWCKQFVLAGISPSRLYTHIAAPFIQETTNGPIWNAFNEYSRPGWTTYPVRFLSDDFGALYDELKEHGYPVWGGVEANAGFPMAMGEPEVGWEEYLARHFNHGAKLVAINFGASSEKLTNLLRDSALSPEATAAYKKFLAGEPLQASPSRLTTGPGGEEPPAAIQQKMKQVHASTLMAEEQGRDISRVHQVMQGFYPLMKEGKFKEAEAVLDRALELLKQTAPPLYKGPPSY